MEEKVKMGYNIEGYSEYPKYKPIEKGYYKVMYFLEGNIRIKPILWNGYKWVCPNGDVVNVKSFDENTHSLYYTDCLKK